MAGAGYDFATNIISSDGKVFQLEYAEKAVEKSGTAIGVRCRDGVILATEKLVHSKMLVRTSNRMVHKVDERLGVAVAGMSADGRAVARMAQNICVRFRQNFGEAITPATLAEQLADVFYAYTSYAAYRPFGVHALVVGYDDEAREHELYLCELDGTFHRYFGTAIGKGARSAKTEIQKLKVSTMTCREALPTVARILHSVHDSTKDKPFVLEMGWVCEETGWAFREVPEELVRESDDAGRRAAEAEGVKDADGDLAL